MGTLKDARFPSKLTRKSNRHGSAGRLNALEHLVMARGEGPDTDKERASA